MPATLKPNNHKAGRRLVTLLGLVLLLVSVLTGGTRADAIHDAADRGDVTEVQYLLREDARRIEAPNPVGATPLLCAAIHGQLAVARILIEGGAQVNRPLNDGWTPLHAAVCDGDDAAHNDIARLLIAHDAQLDARRKDGWTPLHAAAYKGNAANVRILLDAKAALNPMDSAGKTPLHLAAEQGRTAVVSTLLSRGADAALADNQGRTPLKRALAAGKTDTAAVLLSSRPTWATDRARYAFQHTISREVLNNYLSHAISHVGLCATSPEASTPTFDDDLRMLLHIGAKFIGRAAYA